MIFGYWTDSAGPCRVARPRAGIAEWTKRCPDYTLFSDDAVAPLLNRWGKHAEEIFRDISIPACKSDVARLVLLHEYGGLYVDAHCAPGASERLTRMFSWLAECDLLLFDESTQLVEHRHTWILNGVLAARARATVLGTLIRRAFDNLAVHRRRERLLGRDRVAYDIYKLTGPWMIWHELFRRVPIGGELKARYRSRVAIWPLDSATPQPVRLYQHNSYRSPAMHWSKRQDIERLFLSTAVKSHRRH